MLIVAFNIQAQQVTIKVINVKGKVYYNNKLLKGMQFINVPSIQSFEQNLKYSSPTDFVKVVYNKAPMTFPKGAVSNTSGNLTRLYTKGAKVFINASEFKEYFGQNEIWLWKDDTVIVKRSCGIKLNNKDTLFLASYSYNGESQNIQLNKHDTVIFSKKNLYYCNISDKYKWINSFEVDSFNLSLYNPEPSQGAIIGQVSNIYFVDDYVRYLNDSGVNSKSISSELINVIGVKNLTTYFGCKEEEISGFLEKYVDSTIKQ